MPSEKAIALRDELNKIVDRLIPDRSDQESNVLACCVALAIEEIEKWMYDGSFTPSVVPYRKNVTFHFEKENYSKINIVREWEDNWEIHPAETVTEPVETPFFLPVSVGSASSAPVQTWNGSVPEATDPLILTRYQALKDSGKLEDALKGRNKEHDPFKHLEPAQWSYDIMQAFKEGKKEEFIYGIKNIFPNKMVSFTEASDYFIRMKKEYPFLWKTIR